MPISLNSHLRRAARDIHTRQGLSTMSDAIYSKLYDVLFPGEEEFSPKQTSRLAAKLRQVATDLQPSELQISTRIPRRDLDFTEYQRRYVALEILYVGHDFHGFARQDNAGNTIEEHIFAAMTKSRLIPPGQDNWQDLRYSRGGRTDKGVSALGQVVALTLRSAGRSGQPPLSEEQEYDYPAILNRSLPPEIRVLGWTTVPEMFSARFNARFREYKYFIVDDNHNALDVEKMRQAASLFVGEHDFRNFCKRDVTAVKSFIRRILEVRLEEVTDMQSGSRRILELYVRGTAFLWHQIRCIAAVLLMIGRGEEQPSIIHTLLDVERTPRKPQYIMASEEPLLLYSCCYQGLQFRRSPKAYKELMEGMHEAISSHLTRAAILQSMEERLAADEVYEEYKAAAKRVKAPTAHVPLLQRALGLSVEELVEKKPTSKYTGVFERMNFDT